MLYSEYIINELYKNIAERQFRPTQPVEQTVISLAKNVQQEQLHGGPCGLSRVGGRCGWLPGGWGEDV